MSETGVALTIVDSFTDTACADFGAPRFLLELGVSLDVGQIRVLRVVLEVGVQGVAQAWRDHVEQPTDVVVHGRQQLRNGARFEP